MTLLPQINPLQLKDEPEMHAMQLHHSHQICGIVLQVKDRGVASVAILSLYFAAEVLADRREQEVLQIFERIRRETGWKVGVVQDELKEKWGWLSEEMAGQQTTQRQNSVSPTTTQREAQATSADSLLAPAQTVVTE